VWVNYPKFKQSSSRDLTRRAQDFSSVNGIPIPPYNFEGVGEI